MKKKGSHLPEESNNYRQTLVRQVTILVPTSSYFGEKLDLLFDEDGLLVSVGKKLSLPSGAHELKSKDLYASGGWVDMACVVPVPGYEWRETFATAERAALAGGFTDVVVYPEAQPKRSTASHIRYFHSSAGTDGWVRFHPYACLSEKGQGIDLAELYDSSDEGVAGFTDGFRPLEGGFLYRALQYVSAIKGGLVITHPDETSLHPDGQMNEGEMSVWLGMKGIPAIAEETALYRDLSIARYLNSPIHIGAISTEGSVRLIKEAKKKQLVTCSLPAYLLGFSDSELAQYDTRLKVFPPLREKSTIKALIKGIKEGTIDASASFHTPLDSEAKDLEFDLAEFGMIGLQTCYSVLNMAENGALTQEEIARLLADGPRKILQWEVPTLEKKERTCLTLFDPTLEWEYNEKNNFSLSKNSPLLGRVLKGKALGIYSDNRFTPSPLL